MRSGTLRKRVIIEAPTDGKDAQGTPTLTWSEHRRAWAAVIPISGKEREEAESIGAIVTHRVRMRYVVGVTPRMRLRYGERIFNIVSIRNHNERSAMYEIDAVEHTDEVP